MIDKLLNVIELFNNSNLWKAEDILRQNEYKKFCAIFLILLMLWLITYIQGNIIWIYRTHTQ